MCIENKESSQGIHYLRYIISWVHEGGTFDTHVYHMTESECKEKYLGYHGFKAWLKSIGLPEEEVKDIVSMCECGKLELEEAIRWWFKEEKWRE